MPCHLFVHGSLHVSRWAPTSSSPLSSFLPTTPLQRYLVEDAPHPVTINEQHRELICTNLPGRTARRKVDLGPYLGPYLCPYLGPYLGPYLAPI